MASRKTAAMETVGSLRSLGFPAALRATAIVARAPRPKTPAYPIRCAAIPNLTMSSAPTRPSTSSGAYRWVAVDQVTGDDLGSEGGLVPVPGGPAQSGGLLRGRAQGLGHGGGVRLDHPAGVADLVRDAAQVRAQHRPP